MSARYGPGIRRDSAHCLGGYVFFWGTKYEFTPTWFSLFEATGEKTELVDEMWRLWRGHYPPNRAPHLSQLVLGGKSLDDDVRVRAGRSYTARIVVTDPEGDSLTTQWELRPDVLPGATNKDILTPLEPIVGAIMQAGRRQALVHMPRQPGAYRLFVHTFDGHGSVGTANMPLLIEVADGSVAAHSVTIRP